MRIENAPAASGAGRLTFHRRHLQGAALWAFVFAGSFVRIEPSPYEALFVCTAGLFAITGLRLHASLAPLVLLLGLFNVGGLLSLSLHPGWSPGVTFIGVSIYLALTALFFASLMLEHTSDRLDLIRNASVATGLVAGLLGVAGYFSPALEVLTRNGRAMAFFKDPNVYGPYLVLPILWCLHRLLERGTGSTSTTRDAIFAAGAAAVMTFAVFLSFSRGAWGVLAGGALMTFVLSFLTSAGAGAKTRMLLLAAFGGVFAIGMLALAQTLPGIGEALDQRASLTQDYDLGPLGRFGGQLRSLPLLLESPLGFGPLRFPIVVGNEDPHNVYVNAFAAYGWIGGLAYFALIATTCFIGWRLALVRGPFRKPAIPIWSATFLQILQGFQIDTDHWRHFYMLVGLVWGLAAADMTLRARKADSIVP